MALNFPDVNVWLALVWSHHQHSRIAVDGYRNSSPEKLFFCRITQLSLLRLLTTNAVMGEDVVTMRKAWEIYDELYLDTWIQFLEEPAGLDRNLGKLTAKNASSPKLWADAYLAAFGDTAGLRVVTFDAAIRTHSMDALILR